MNFLKGLCATTLFSICTSVSCSTLANYFLPPLNKRHLRVSRAGPFTEYRWTERACKTRVLGLCIKNESIEHIEHDFDFTKEADRKNFNDMGFDCSVREMPK